MEARKTVELLLLSTLTCMIVCESVEIDLTVEISAGAIECFFQNLKRQVTAEIEYQVIDGGDLDIDFSSYSPDGRMLQMEHRKTENVVRINSEMEGDYKFCFDNSFSRMSPKVVFFEIIAESDDDDDDNDGDDWKIDAEEVRDMMDITVEELKGIIDRAKQNLDKSVQLQNLIKVHEARDRNIAESNFSRVNTLSSIQLVIMITVGLTQVLMIRSLFQDRGKPRPGGVKQQT